MNTPFTQVLDESNAPFFTWFEDGQLNASYKSMDRHVEAGNGARLAIIFEADDGTVPIQLQTLAMMNWSRNPLPFPQLLLTDPTSVIKATDTAPGAVISTTEIVIIVVALLVMCGLLLLVQRPGSAAQGARSPRTRASRA